MPRFTRIIADLTRQSRGDPDANTRARSFVARLSGVLESRGHKALADDLFALLDDSVVQIQQSPRAVQAELVERYVVPTVAADMRPEYSRGISHVPEGATLIRHVAIYSVPDEL